MIKTKVDEAVQWYTENFSKYKSLASYVEGVLKPILAKEKINYHSITSRPKSISSYQEKASKEKYLDPKKEIMDMAGIRIITYLDSDVKKVEEVVKSIFDVIPEHSIDKSKKLGIDKVGYKSIHCVCTLDEDRKKLAENNDYSDCLFEIQIRTLLQHAWAEFEHDRNYKFKGILPNFIKRRLSIVAGSLELIDWSFEAIEKSVDEYVYYVQEKTSKGDLATKITSASIQVYLGRKFEKLISKGLETDLVSDSILNDLSALKVNTLEELDNLIPKDFIDICLKYNYFSSYTSMLIDAMIILDHEKYFNDIWKVSWTGLSPESINVLKHYGVPMDDYLKKYHFDVEQEVPQSSPIDFEPPEYAPDFQPPEHDYEDYEPQGSEEFTETQ